MADTAGSTVSAPLKIASASTKPLPIVSLALLPATVSLFNEP